MSLPTCLLDADWFLPVEPKAKTVSSWVGSPRGLLGVTADVTVTQTVLLGAEACVLPWTYRKLNPCDKKWLFYLFFMEESHPCVIVNSTDGKQSSCFTKRNRVF